MKVTMLRVHLFLAAVILLGAGTCCKHSEPSAPLVVHVLRDPSATFAGKLRQADLQFALTKPHLDSGKEVMVATNEGKSFAVLLQQFTESGFEVLILDSQAGLPENPAIRDRLGKAELVCGQHPAFVPTSVSGELREASQVYLRFLASHCDVATVALSTDATRPATEAQPPAAKVTPQSIVQEMFPNAPKKAKNGEYFRSFTPRMSIYMVVEKCGRPDEEIGSGLYIFVYHLQDGSTVAIGTSSLNKIDHVAYTDSSGKSASLLSGNERDPSIGTTSPWLLKKSLFVQSGPI